MRHGDYSYLEKPHHCDKSQRSLDRLDHHNNHVHNPYEHENNPNILNVKKPH